MAAPAPAPAQAQKPGPLSDSDMDDWKTRINDVLARPGEHVNSKSPETSQAWNSPFFGCFTPIDTCLMTWCIPCVTFGKTHHRLRKNGNLDGYEPINTSVSLRGKRQENTTADIYLPVPPLLRQRLRRSPLDPHVHAARRHPLQVQPPG